MSESRQPLKDVEIKNILELEVGSFVKKRGSNFMLEVLEVGNEWQSGYDFAVIFNDVTKHSQKLINLDGYIKA